MSKSLPVLDERSSLLGRRCVLSSLGALALVGCSGATSDVDAGDPDAGDDGATADAADETAQTCSTSLGKLVGTEAQFPVGTWKLVGQLIIAQDTTGFFAFSAVCTHQGCLVNAPSKTGTTICYCHGSEFDGNGAVLKGPATTPLPHYALSVCNGNVYVNTGSHVAATTRTPPA
jgi:Rieske Fe-S protein